MAEPFLSEIRMMSFVFAPKGWALSNGQLLPINQNQALFSLLGTTYGGDGRVNFALPDVRGRVPIHMGAGHTLGERGGSQSVTLGQAQMPTHIHFANAESTVATSDLPTGNMLAASAPNTIYGPVQNLEVSNLTTITNVGGNQPHLNTQPFLTLSFCIALQGIFPSQT
jgi:microcystin-dependent protein